ncbi:MAG: FixH family protein [Chitinophagaceae bacterium]|nr:FixH family protein [Chitinophagaceae bacterium]
MNWGNKLLVTFIVFGAGMSFLVYRSMNTNYELVDKEYYKNELRYQEVIDGVNRANALSDVVKLTQTSAGIALQLPAEMKGQRVSGTVHFYCDYDARNDRKFGLSTDTNGMQVLDDKLVASGSYLVKISWKAGDKDYYTEKPLTIN